MLQTSPKDLSAWHTIAFAIADWADANCTGIVWTLQVCFREKNEVVLERHTIPGDYSEWGGELVAIIYSVVQTCRQHGVNPTAYLRLYLEACLAEGGGEACAPADLKPYLPWNLKSWISE